MSSFLGFFLINFFILLDYVYIYNLFIYAIMEDKGVKLKYT